MYVYRYIYIYIYIIYIYIYYIIHIYIYIYIYIYIFCRSRRSSEPLASWPEASHGNHSDICLYIKTMQGMSIYLYNTCMYVCMCVYIYIYMYIYKHHNHNHNNDSNYYNTDSSHTQSHKDNPIQFGLQTAVRMSPVML